MTARVRLGARRGAALLAACLLLLAGCGREEETSFGEQVTTVVQRHAAAIERHQATARAAAPEDPAGAAAGLQSLAIELEALAADVEALDEPPDRRAAARDLVEAYRLLARAALELRTALLGQDAAAARMAQADYTAATARERAAAAAVGAE